MNKKYYSLISVFLFLFLIIPVLASTPYYFYDCDDPDNEYDYVYDPDGRFNNSTDWMAENSTASMFFNMTDESEVVYLRNDTLGTIPSMTTYEYNVHYYLNVSDFDSSVTSPSSYHYWVLRDSGDNWIIGLGIIESGAGYALTVKTQEASAFATSTDVLTFDEEYEIVLQFTPENATVLVDGVVDESLDDLNITTNQEPDDILFKCQTTTSANTPKLVHYDEFGIGEYGVYGIAVETDYFELAINNAVTYGVPLLIVLICALIGQSLGGFIGLVAGVNIGLLILTFVYSLSMYALVVMFIVDYVIFTRGGKD